MSQFVKHENCPKCGSKDNLARYDDGHAWCFGCYYWEPASVSSIFDSLREGSQKPEIVKTYNGNNLEMPPDDTTPFIGVRGLQWLAKYGILAKEAKDFLWSDSKQWLIFPIYSARALRDHDAKVLIAWQARNLNPDRPKPKYLTRGPVGDLFCVIGPHEGETLYVVEDYLSAIKVGRSQSAFPLFGSHMSNKLLVTLTTRFRKLGVWLDMDKAVESLKTVQRASQMGFERVFSIITPKDPKEYSNDEINKFIVDHN